MTTMRPLRAFSFSTRRLALLAAVWAPAIVLAGAACSSSNTTPAFSFDAGTTFHFGTGSGSGSSIVNPGSGTGSGVTPPGSGTGTGTQGTGTGTGCTTDTGAITGTVTTTGGSVSRLVFAAVGDTRPATENEPDQYPTAIITKIFSDINSLGSAGAPTPGPKPVLAVGTGDYQFSSASLSNQSVATQQVQIFETASKTYTGPFFPAMGNHECGVSGSYTTSDNNDCGPGNPGGVTANYTAFMDVMMQPLGQSNPYYSFNVNATDNSWTAKFVITAANAWSTAQQTWLTTTMAQKTTYTFVVRHEASDATPPIPDCIPTIDSIISAAGYTLLIVGHTHDYGHYSDAPQTVVFGNGGAPLSSSNYDYGYGLFAQRCDGAIVVDEVDYMTGATDSKLHFVITPAGQITQ